MRVKPVKPKSTLLQNYILFFYIHKRIDNDKDETFLVFPNIYGMLSVFKDAKITSDSYSVLIQYNKDTFTSILDVKYVAPLVATYKNAVDEITIAFKPLGINSFLEYDLDYYLTESISTHPFIPYEDYEESLKIIFSKDDDQKIELLESYLLTNLNTFHILYWKMS